MIGEILLTTGLGLYVACSLLLFVYGLNSYVMIGLFLRSRRRLRAEDRAVREGWAGRLADHELPVVTTQLPVYNERHVIERLLRATCALDWPRDRHEIQLLDDSTDETTTLAAGLVAELRAAGHDVVHVHRDDRTGYKAGALAAGLALARGEFVAVLDADFTPDPDFLRRTVPHLLADPGCAFVQTRWGHRNRDVSLLTRLLAMGIDGHFAIEQAARAGSGLFFNFNGTGGVWRREAIADAGGWRPDTLTEDLDLSYRALLRGWRPRYLPDAVCPAEIPTDVNALKSQQRRWAKGSIQCALKLIPRVLREGGSAFRKVQAVLHLTHYLIHPLILIMTLLVLPLIQFLELRFAAPFTAPMVAAMLLALIGPSTLYVVSQAATRERWLPALALIPCLVALGIGLAVNNSRAVWEALRGQRSEFVRTPKLGEAAEARGGRGGSAVAPASGAASGAASAVASAVAVASPGAAYRGVWGRLYLVEIFMGLWALAAFAGYLVKIGSLSGALLLVQAVGFTWMGLISLQHRHQWRWPWTWCLSWSWSWRRRQTG